MTGDAQRAPSVSERMVDETKGNRMRSLRIAMITVSIAVFATMLTPGMVHAERGPAKGKEAATGIEEAPASREIAAKLRAGKLVIVMRHCKAQSHETQAETDLPPFNNCEKQRNLTDEGKQQARDAGEAITKTLKAPIGEVWSTPLCRGKETATLAFGKCATKMCLAQTEGPGMEDARKALMSEVTTGGNRVVVTHSNILDHLGFKSEKDETLPEGTAVLIEPQNLNQFVVLGYVLVNDWKKFELVMPSE